MRLRFALLTLAFLGPLLRAQPAAAEPPLVALPPAILQKVSTHGDTAEKNTGAALAERVQLALQSETAWRFVERDALDVISREHQLSLAGATDGASAIRTGRLSHADWILRLRLRADDSRARVEAEIVDALRADLLGQAETPLASQPDESWLLQPTDAAVETTRATVLRALADARAREASFAGRTVLAPLAFLDRDESGRLAPLGRLLNDALRAEHPGIRVLGYERPDGAMNESTLFQAGMTDLAAADWARVADVFLWGEYSEDTARKGNEPPVLLRLWLWRDDSEPRLLSFRGDFSSLENLAREAASAVLAASVGGRVDATEDTRARAARRLIAAADDLKPKHRTSWKESPLDKARRQARLRLLTLAAFFAPENSLLREQVTSLGLSLSPDTAARAVYQRQFWLIIDQFLIGPDGRPNLTLLARAARYDANFPGYPARFERIGRILAAHPLDDETMRDIHSRFSYAVSELPHEPGLAAARAAMDPILRRLGASPVSPNTPRTAPPSPDGRLFTAWEKTPVEQLLVAARSGPLANAPVLDAPQVRFSPWELAPRVGKQPPRHSLASAVVGDHALWLTLLVSQDDAEARLHSSARIDLRTHQIEWLPARLSSENPVSAYWLEGSKVWMGTRGNGLRLLDQTTGNVTILDQVAGLPLADVIALHRGKNGLYLASGATSSAPDVVVTRIDPQTAAISQEATPAGTEFSTLPAALRAAIVSFGDDAPPRVALPSDPAIGFDDSTFVSSDASPVPAEIPANHRLAPGAGGRYTTENDPALARHACLTGPRDGYWVAGHHSLVWAAGSRRVPLAHWITGCIRSLADDGRHLFVQVRRQDSPEGSDAGRTGSPSNVRIYVYDHVEGRWLGWMSTPQFGPMHAGPGLLALADVSGSPTQPLLLINTSRLGGASPAPISATTSPTGWTPLLSALWADDASTVERLLAAGARWDVADVRGWHPLQLAAAWSSPACLETLLRHGVPGDQARPAPDPALTKTYAGRADNRETALHAAVLAGRAATVDRLLAAGADPRAFDPAGNPLQLACRHATLEIVARLLPHVPEEKYREPLRISAKADGRMDLLALIGAPAPSLIDALVASRRSQDPIDRLRDALQPTPPDLARARTALEAGADPAKFDGSSAPFLEAAARDRKFAAFELMLGFVKPEVLNKVDPDGCLGADVLRQLLAAKRLDLARKLLAAGYKPAPPPNDDSGFFTPSILWLAVLAGDADLVRQLRHAGFLPPRNSEQHPLREAVRQQNADLLRALLEPVPNKEANLEVDNSNGNGRTAIFDATDAGWTEGVRILLAAGSTSCEGDRFTRRSLRDVAALSPEIAILLNRRPASPDNQLAGAEAVAAVFRNDASLATLPIDSAVLRYRDFWDWTVLHHAARQGRYEFVGRLLASRAAVDALTSAGETPLCLAVFGGDATCVNLLLTARAQPNLHRAPGSLPLHLATRAVRVDLMKRLLTAGADPNRHAGPDGTTPALIAASTRDEIETLHLLVAAGASLAATNKAGHGALEASVLSDSAEKIQYLLDRGLGWQKSRWAHYHPMDVAAREGLTSSIRKLQQLGLQSPRALSLAKDDATRALLQGDQSEAGRRFRNDEVEWPTILADSEHWRERASAHVTAGGNVNHRSATWGTPLKLAVHANDPERVAWLVGKGADAAAQIDQGVSLYGYSTVFYGWISSQKYWREQLGTLPPERDEAGLAYLTVFWRHETRSDYREQMTQSADKAGLPKTHAWMSAHLLD